MRVVILTLLVLLLGLCHCEKNYTSYVASLNTTLTNPRLPYYHWAYQKLAYVVDTFGPRMWGSNNLELTIDEMAKQAVTDGFQNIRKEPVRNFTKWVRGRQSLIMLSPRPVHSKLEVTSLGFSVDGDVTGDVIVIKDWNQLDQRRKEVIGKIVCLNHQWVNYSVNGDYRVNGASKVARYGAIAMLVRSVAPSSIGSVHTGYMLYDASIKKIPAAAITIEDADMFQRMQDRGQKITVHLVLQNQFIGNCNSSNLVFEIVGSTYPQQIILAGGHIDSWDTGSQTGANDDGGGFMTVFAALKLIKSLGVVPKRTIRFIAWSGEESGSPIDGAAQYLQEHRSQLKNHILGFQSDGGSSLLTGFGHTGDGADIVKSIISNYLANYGVDKFSPNDGQSADVSVLYEAGQVPMIKNLPKDTSDDAFYFRYHHSAGDTMSIMNPDQMDSNVFGIAALLYIIADLDTTLRQVPTHQHLTRVRSL